MRLQNPTAFPFNVRSGWMNFRPRCLARVNVPLDLKIGVRLKRTGGADRRHSGSKIKPRKAIRHLPINPIPHGIKHVIMHPDEPGNYRVAMQIEHLGVLGNVRVSSAAYGPNLPIRQHQSLVLLRRGVSAINYPHMLQRDNRRIHLDELFDLRRERLGK